MLSRESVNQLISQIQNGNDNLLRARAISTLSIGYLRSDDRVIGGIIADFVNDRFVSNDLRLFAYLCLLDVSPRNCDEYPDLATFRFPET